MLTLLEMAAISLHDYRESRAGCPHKAWTDMAASEAGGATLTGRLGAGGSTVSLGVAVAIVVADMVGVGVFTSLGI